MSGEKVIGFRLRVRGSEDTIKKLAAVELELSDVGKQMRSTKKALNEAIEQNDIEKVNALRDTYGNLRIAQQSIRDEANKLRKEIREQKKDFDSLANAEGSYRQQNDELVALRKAFKELSGEEKRTGEITEETARKFGLVTRSVSDLIGKINSLDQDLKEQDATIGNFQRNVGNYPQQVTAIFDSVIPGFSQIGGLLDTLSEGMEDSADTATKAGKAINKAFIFLAVIQALSEIKDLIGETVEEFTELRGTVRQFTQESGDNLDNFTSRTAALATTFKKDSKDLAESVNSVAKAFEIDFGQALDYVEAGFISGADANGDYLDKLREYPAQFKAANLGAEQLISTIVQEVNQGVLSDKGVATVKEFGLRIREQASSTRDALEGAFGKSFTDNLLKGIREGSISAGEALSDISEQINDTEIPVDKLQAIIADVFGGDGEDAALPFIKSLEGIDEATIDAIDSQNQYLVQQKALLEANKGLADANNDLAKSVGAGSNAWEIFGIKVQEFGIRTLNGLFEGFAPVFIAFRELGAEIFKLLGIFPSVGKGFTLVDKLGKALSASLRLTLLPLRLIVGGLTLVTRGIRSFFENTAAGQQIVAAFFALFNRLSGAFQGFRNNVGGAISVISSALAPVLETINQLFNEVFSVISDVITTIIDLARQIPILNRFFSQSGDFAQRFLEAFQRIPAVFAGTVSALLQLATNFTNFFRTQLINTRLFAKQIELAFSIGNARQNVRNEINALLQERSDIEAAGKSIGEAYREGFRKALEERESISIPDPTANNTRTPFTPDGVDEDQAKQIEDATKAIRDLKTELIDDEFDKQIENLKNNAADRIGSLVGSPEQIQEQTQLINELLDQQIRDVENKRQQQAKERLAAQEATLREIAEFRKQISLSSISSGILELDGDEASLQRQFEFDSASIEESFREQRDIIFAEFQKNLITEEEFNKKLLVLEDEKNADILSKKKALNFQLDLINFERQQAELNLLEEQKNQVAQKLEEENKERKRIIREREANGELSPEDANQAILDSDALLKEQLLEQEREYQNERAEILEEVALENIERQREIAEEEYAISQEKNERIRQQDEETLKKQKALTDVQIGVLGDFISLTKDLLGKDEKNRKKYAGILKTIAIGEIAINLQKQLSSIATAAGADLAKTGLIGGAFITPLAAIQSAIAVARAGIQTAAVLSQFEKGGALSDSVSGVPTEGTLSGPSHSRGGIKRGAYEFEGGEYKLNNGSESYIINKKNTSLFRPLLNTLRGQGKRYSPRRRAIASAINSYGGNGIPFAFGGALPGTPPLDPPILADLSRNGSADIMSSLAENNILLSDNLIEQKRMVEETNRRIDRIEVITDPVEIYGKGKEGVEERNLSEL